MGILAYITYCFVGDNSKLLSVLLPAVVGGLAYVICCLVFKIKEFSDIVNALVSKIKGGAVR